MATGVRACDLCGGGGYEIICTRDRRGKPLHTAACTECGLVGHETVPTEQELADYYARHYRQEYHGEATPSARRVWRAWIKGQRVVKDLAPFLTPGASVFEVGAGIGCNVKSFELAGFEASGLEPGTSFQQFSAEQLRARIHHCSLSDFQFVGLEPGGRGGRMPHFDLVLLIHVIEHFRSPRLALEVIQRLLRPGGRLYLECPSLAVTHTDHAEMFHFAHIHTFTPSTLLQLLRQCGFEPEFCFSNGLGCNHKFLLRRVSTAGDRSLKAAATNPVATNPVAAGFSLRPPADGRGSDTVIDPDGYAQTLELLRQYQVPWRRFSLDYFRRRMRRIRLYVQEFLFGKVALARILRQCQMERPVHLRQSA
ncbi:MAG: class I SAM-dependent methyltransferase [Gemmataceae bacterium]|nr:class I SAM-dependent methyltransferase [Gemmataceae bacterium]MCI0740720.1 class I SAM-dependent methyltransferase [Gemmataceae bacterium]